MGIMDMYNYLVYEYVDSRTDNWLLVKNPIPITLMCASYLYFVLGCGPRFMKDKQPYSLITFTKCYNIFQVIANAGFIYELYRVNYFRDYGLRCLSVGYQTNYQAMRIADLCWWLLLLKIFDFTETFVFILRKKEKQISFLHLYHHVSTVFLCWLIVKRYALGVTMFILIINCGVHVIMYTYYFLSTLGPSIQRRLGPLKRAVTIIQMVQFILLMAYSAQAFMPECDIDRGIAIILQVDLLTNLILFYRFYQSAYTKPKRK